MAQWVPDDLPLLGASSGSSTRAPSVTGSVSSHATTDSGATKYMAPGVRARLLRARNDGKVATAEADLAEARLRAAEAERSAAKMLQGKLPKFSLPFFLNKQQLNLLTTRFPRTEFACSADNAHDHPLAHTETMIAVQKALRMAPGGSYLVDLYGSPRDMDAFVSKQAKSNAPKRGLAYVGLKTEKDYLRALKWGDNIDGKGRPRYVQHWLGPVDDFGVTASGIQVPTDSSTLTDVPGRDVVWFSKHTMYYLSDEEICRLLAPTGSRMLSIVHRHPNSSGTLFGGECSYAKIGGVVEQINTLTGERYVHRDLSYLWDSKSKVVRTSVGAYVWTFHMVSEDTWIIELTGCPASLDERFVSREKAVGVNAACSEMNEHDVAPTRFPHPALAKLPMADCTMVGGVPVIKFTNGAFPDCKLTSPALYEFLAASIVGKPRDTERLHDLFSLARSHVVNGQDHPGKKNFNVSHEDIASHVILAFVAGLGNETALLRAAQGYRMLAREHVAVLDGNAIIASTTPTTALTSGIQLARRVNNASGRKDVFGAILDAVER